VSSVNIVTHNLMMYTGTQMQARAYRYKWMLPAVNTGQDMYVAESNLTQDASSSSKVT